MSAQFPCGHKFAFLSFLICLILILSFMFSSKLQSTMLGRWLRRPDPTLSPGFDSGTMKYDPILRKFVVVDLALGELIFPFPVPAFF